MTSLEILGISIIVICIVLCAICIVILDQVKTTRKHLRQIEKKIDAIYTQIRSKDYVYPSTYKFVTKMF